MNGAKFFHQVKLVCKLSALSLLAAAMPSAVYAQTDQVDSEAVIVSPLSFIEVNDLKFGKIIPSSTSDGTVVLSPFGGRTANNGIVLVGNDQTPAEFAGQGSPFQIVDISVGSNTIWLYGPGPRLRVRQFRIGSTPTTLLTTNPRYFYIGAPTGIFRFPVGAEVRIRQNQPTGVYSGTWDITLNYN